MKEKITLDERMNQIYEEEARRLGIELSDIDILMTTVNDFPHEDPNRYNAVELPQTHVKRKDERYILELFEGDLSNEESFRSVIRHEFYHIFAGHLDKRLGNNIFARIIRYFSREWAAIAYQYLGVKL